MPDGVRPAAAVDRAPRAAWQRVQFTTFTRAAPPAPRGPTSAPCARARISACQSLHVHSTPPVEQTPVDAGRRHFAARKAAANARFHAHWRRRESRNRAIPQSTPSDLDRRPAAPLAQPLPMPRISLPITADAGDAGRHRRRPAALPSNSALSPGCRRPIRPLLGRIKGGNQMPDLVDEPLRLIEPKPSLAVRRSPHPGPPGFNVRHPGDALLKLGQMPLKPAFPLLPLHKLLPLRLAAISKLNAAPTRSGSMNSTRRGEPMRQ